MSKKKPIEFWIVELYDPTAEMEYEEYENLSRHYVRTEKEARSLIENHTIEHMPKETDTALDAAWKAYKEWTPFDPQTGEPNTPIAQPKNYEAKPLFKWKETPYHKYPEGTIGTVINSMAQAIGADNIDENWNEGIWEDEYFASAHLHTIE